jgi:MoaA/NifB/PqqE/SkfB family radical SAM enzyme
MDLYARIAGELAAFRATLEAVFMINYNEPTADPRFLEQVRVHKRHELPVAVLSNGWGLTPARVDAILEMGGLRYLSVNISTLDRERYTRDRGADHLPIVLRNLDGLRERRIAPQMELVVLGRGDEQHRSDFAEIRERFAGSLFEVKSFEVMDRAGYLPFGLKPERPAERLRGCDNVGSRPLQHLHVSPHGTCVLCCEDYDERWVVGDLRTSSVAEVLRGPEIARLRRFAYGIEDAPEDFICRKCVFALTG